jgi:hypothetical protein
MKPNFARPIRMTRRTALGLGLVPVGVVAVVLVSACVDLFHSTSFETLCEVDAKAPGCGMAEASKNDVADAADAGSTDFCLWSTKEAKGYATHACAMIGACTAPFDHNAFGQCMIDAILAYDCTTNPNKTIAAGPLHEYWDALWRAKSCKDIPSLNPNGDTCGDGFGCLPDGSSPYTVLECVSNKTEPETCLVVGKVCGGDQFCVTPNAKKSCDPPSCEKTVLHACESRGKDEGYDCKYFGLGACVAGGGTGGCSPNEMFGASPCSTSRSVTCDGGTATGCGTGVTENVNCDNLTGAGTCVGGTPSWDVASACQGSETTCTPGCSADGDTLTGCAQGAKFTATCKTEGLGPCHSVKLPTSTGYACEPR